MRPKVSIIVPVYNVEKYLSTCLDSLINQTLQDIEIICVNDATPDGCQMILEEYAAKDKRISIYQHSRNRGLSAARNTGLEQAEGAYVYFMDSDDILELNAMELCYQTAKEKYVDIVMFDAISFCEEGCNIAPNNYSRVDALQESMLKPLYSTNMLEKLLNTGTFSSSACLVFIKRDLLMQFGLRFEEGLLHEDELFTPQLFVLAKQIIYVPNRFFHRRVRQGSIMHSLQHDKKAAAYIHIIDELQTAAKQLKISYKAKKLLYQRAWELSKYVLGYATQHEVDIQAKDVKKLKRNICRQQIVGKATKLFTGEFMRFCIVGVLATGIHYGIYYLLYNLCGVWMNISYTLGFIISFIANFYLSNYFTFHTKPDWKKLLGMSGVHGLNYLNHIILLNFFVWLGVSANLAPIPVYLIAIPVNFLMVRFVFKKV